MSWRIHYTDCGSRSSVAVDCSLTQAGRIAKLLPNGRVVGTDPVPRDPERAAILAVLTTKFELERIAEKTK